MSHFDINQIWGFVVMAFAVTAGFSDVWKRKIPRWLTVGGFFAGLIFHAFRHDFVPALATAAIALAIGMALFAIGAIGGGDVKLIAALGAMLGFQPWAKAMVVSIFVAGGMAVIQILRHHAVRQTLRNLAELFRTFFRLGLKAHPVVNVSNRALIRSPYAVAAAIGTVAAVMNL